MTLLTDAALQSRLPPLALSDREEKLFPRYKEEGSASIYLHCRNFVLVLWFKNCTSLLTLKNIQSTYRQAHLNNSSNSILSDAYFFLHRYRYINNGLFKIMPEILLNDPKISSNAINPRHKRPRIVIIGAGMAGISTARELMNIYAIVPDTVPRPEIIILEGRKRVGGRIFTFPLHTKRADSNIIPSVDLAAQIITGLKGNPMNLLVTKQLRLNLHYLKNAKHTRIYDVDGILLDADLDAQVESIFNTALDNACQTYVREGVWILDNTTKIRHTENSKLNFNGEKQPTLGEAIMHHLNLDEKFRKFTFSQLKLVHWHLANLEFANAGLVDALSLHHWDQDDDINELSGYHCMVQGGYGQVPIALSKGYNGTSPLDIKLNKFVNSITHFKKEETDLIEVGCQDGTVFECDAVVVTLPLGVLKTNAIKFTPSLPPWKMDAIGRLGFGFFNKVVLVFPKCFWNTNVDAFGSLGPTISTEQQNPSFSTMKRGECFLFWNLAPTTLLPVLVLFTSGIAASEMELENDHIIISRAMGVLEKIFAKQVIPSPIEALVTRWGMDEFSHGSYSFIANGATGDDYDLMARRVDGNIFWAGEATCREYPATVHGAWASAQRCATEVADHFLGPLPESYLDMN